jgi:protein-tyrosine phosphatase
LVRSALAELDIFPAGADRSPAPSTTADFESADLIVALSDAEHRPLMTERYPDWHGRTDFWDIDDVGLTPSDVALPAIRERVEALVLELSGRPPSRSV